MTNNWLAVEQPQIKKEFQAGYELTDLGNADRFIRANGDIVRYSVGHGMWLVWDGTRWKKDDLGEVWRLAGLTARDIFTEAMVADSKEESLKLSKWAVRSQDRYQLYAMLDLAKYQVSVLMDTLDKDPWLLNCQNGTINLKTGELQPHNQDDLITKIVNANYYPDAEAPTWMAFLRGIMAENEGMVKFLQRAIGYSLTGKTTEQVFFILHGTGANGKSTFMETIAGLLGEDYAAGIPTDTIMLKHFGDGIPNDLARLKGARFASVNEVENGQTMAEGKIKDMTGEEKLKVRFMRGEWFDFMPEFKLWLRANHKPVIVGTDYAIWRRIRFIPFDVVITPDKQDPNLREELKDEYEGILAWAVKGCLDWQEERLNPPEQVTSATTGYRNEQDVVGHFLAERTRNTGSVSKKALYLAYLNWCEENGDKSVAQRSFTPAIRERGYVETREAIGRGWAGLSLINTNPDTGN